MWLIFIAVFSLIIIISLTLLSFHQKKKRFEEEAKKRAQERIRRYERIDELRHLDMKIAEAFRFYVSVDWNNNYQKATGIPRHLAEYDSYRPAQNRYRENIPHYSTNQSDYLELEKSPVGSRLRYLFLRVPTEEGLNESSANLEQKCIAWLKAQTEKRKR
jgi:hypothetical protein